MINHFYKYDRMYFKCMSMTSPWWNEACEVMWKRLLMVSCVCEGPEGTSVGSSLIYHYQQTLNFQDNSNSANVYISSESRQINLPNMGAIESKLIQVYCSTCWWMLMPLSFWFACTRPDQHSKLSGEHKSLCLLAHNRFMQVWWNAFPCIPYRFGVMDAL